MSLALGVRFVPVSTGTADFVYASTVTGYRTATTVLVNGATYRYRAESADLSQWEFGTAIWSSATSTLSRNTITDSSNAGSKVSFTAQPQVSITIDVPDVLSFDTVMSLTTTQKAQATSNIFVSGPTHQIFTSGSGTYTKPANCLYIRVRLAGGGGGGAGSGTSAAGAGGAGGNTTFGTSLFTANGGNGGVGGSSAANAGGTGGAATGGSINYSGGPGGGSTAVSANSVYGGTGGMNAFFAGGGQAAAAGTANT